MPRQPEADPDRLVRYLGTISSRFVQSEPLDCDTAIRRSLADVCAALHLDAAAMVSIRPDGMVDPLRSWGWSASSRGDTFELAEALWRSDRDVLASGVSVVVDTSSASGEAGSRLAGSGLSSVLMLAEIRERESSRLLLLGSSTAGLWDSSALEFARTVLNLLVSACKRLDTQTNLTLTQRDLERAIDLAGLGTFVFDFRTGLVQLSAGLAQMYGFGDEPVTVTAAETAQRYHPDDRNYLFHLLGSMTEERPGVQVQLRVLHPDGEIRLLRFTSELVRDPYGRPIAMRGTGLDITAVEQRSSEVARLEEAAYRSELEARLARGRRLESLGLLAGGVAHDFNNLLAIISNYATFLEPAVRDDHKAAGDLGVIRKTVADAAKLTKRLLTFGGREGGSPHRRSLDPATVVRESVTLLKSTLPANVKFSVRVEDGLPDVVADPGDFQQILSNLVANAVDAAGPDGHVDVRVRTETIPVDRAEAGRAAGDYLVIEVEDDGVGMTPEQVELAFDPFYTTKGRHEGSGLGLSIVHGIATSLFGWVRIDSAEGAGTTVSVGIPVGALNPEPAAAGPNGLPGSLSEATILLVDDEEDVLESTSRILRGAGYDVLEARTPEGAIEIVRGYSGVIHLVLCDVVLPEMSGFDLVRRLRQERPEIAALHISGHVPPELSGDDPVLPKPFRRDDLLGALDRSLGERNG